MSVTPEKDPNYIYAHPYATLIADEYRMRGGYCIVRTGGTDDHLMLLTRAGRGLFRTPRGDAVPLAAGSLAVIPPGVPHDYGTDPAVGKWHFLWVHVHAPKDWQPFLGIPFGSGRLCRSALLLAAIPPRLRPAAARDCKALTVFGDAVSSRVSPDPLDRPRITRSKSDGLARFLSGKLRSRSRASIGRTHIRNFLARFPTDGFRPH